MIKLQKSTFLFEYETKKNLCEFIMNADTLSMGAHCAKFELLFAEYQCRTGAVFVNSGSSANLILIQALLNTGKLKKGDVVAVSALTWATNIMPIIQLGLIPYLVDCELSTLNVSPGTLLEAFDLQPKIRCLFLTNTLGLSDNISEIVKICHDKNAILIEDNCESLGSQVDGRLLGNFGLASTFSFFVGHHLSTIEGGMVCTDDELLMNHLVMCRAHGWGRNLQESVQKNLRDANGIDEFYSRYTFYELAYNTRPTDINGFIGCSQISYLDYIVETRFNNFKLLNAAAENNRNLVSISVSHMDTVSNFAFPVIVKEGVDVNKYKKIFEENNVEIRPLIAGDMALQPFYKKHVADRGVHQNAAHIHKNGFYFGNNPELTESELRLLAELLLY